MGNYNKNNSSKIILNPPQIIFAVVAVFISVALAQYEGEEGYGHEEKEHVVDYHVSKITLQLKYYLEIKETFNEIFICPTNNIIKIPAFRY